MGKELGRLEMVWRKVFTGGMVSCAWISVHIVSSLGIYLGFLGRLCLCLWVDDRCAFLRNLNRMLFA